MIPKGFIGPQGSLHVPEQIITEAVVIPTDSKKGLIEALIRDSWGFQEGINRCRRDPYGFQEGINRGPWDPWGFQEGIHKGPRDP